MQVVWYHHGNKNGEHLIEKENCLKLLKDHLHKVNFIPQQPSIAIAKQYLLESGYPTANEIAWNAITHADAVSDCSSTLDLGSLTLCCNSDPRTVLHVVCNTLQEKGTKRAVISECLEDVIHHGNDDEIVLEVVDYVLHWNLSILHIKLWETISTLMSWSVIWIVITKTSPFIGSTLLPSKTKSQFVIYQMFITKH